MPDPNLWTLDELLSMDEHTFDNLVGETREYIRDLEGDMDVQRKLTDMGVPTALGVLDNLHKIRDAEVQNLQRMAYAFEARQGRNMV